MALTATDRLIWRMPQTESAVFTEARGISWRKWVVVSVVAIGLAHLLDPIAWRAVYQLDVKEADWMRLLRIQGFLPTWLIIASVWWFERKDRADRVRGTALLALAPTLSGIAAELLKLVFRRLRPPEDVFGYAFRPFSEGLLSNRGMGMPSSHVLVAFGGAFALARLFPKARWVFYLLASGCAFTRVLANKHYVSDTVAAACVAWIVVELLAKRLKATEHY